ncbi:MAG: hypothetical protein HP490_15160 [Nitrospira sp.]|nr:hypothetical protein [Nitrospira sp.]
MANIVGTSGPDILTGTSAIDTIDGLAGNDQLNGGDGNDVLNGGVGDDQLIGGDGNDTYVVDSALDAITETLTGGVDLVQSVIDFTLGVGTNLENLTLIGTDNIDGTGNELNNSLTGNSGNNTLSGGDGVDQLIGNAGNDTLDGGTGADRMAGGLGDDSYVVDAATDVVIEGRNAGTDAVSASVNHTLGANVENLTLVGGDLNGTGNTVNNVIIGTNGINILSGLAGNDILDGADGADQLFGGTGNDTLDGGVGQDSVIGGLGDDRIVMLVTAGDVDVANGEAGNDTLALSGTVGGTGLVVVDLSTGDQVSDIGGAAETLLQSNFEHLDASGLGVGSSVDVTGSAGHNSLIGSDGDDTLDGGNGNDTLNGGVGDDTMIGGAGNDTYVVDSVGDVVDETLSGIAGGVDLVQSAITFTLATHGNVERLTLTGGANRDGTGNALNNILTGNNGDNVLSGGDGHDQLFGGAGGDTLNGEAGNDILNGEAGNDTLDGGIGTDTMAGGLDNDAYVVDVATDMVIEALNAGIDSVSASVNHTLRANVENLTLTGGALNGTGNNLNNVITGTNGNNVLTGLGGNDTMDGGDGDDVLNGGLGVDSQQGGNGDDVFLIGSLTEFAAGETINGGADADILRYIGAAGTLILTNLITNLEQVQIATAAGVTTGTAAVNINASAVGNALTITGNNGANVLTGTAFNDMLFGNGGHDRLDGGLGDDTLVGGAGNDTYVVDGVGDVVNEALSGAAGGVDLIQSAITFTLATHGNVEHLTLLGSALDGTGNALNNILTGNSGNNVLTGDAGNDVLTGNAGDDTLDGGAGIDRMAGGLGDDIYEIDSARDTVTEALNAGTDLVRATVSKVLGSNVEHLTLLGSGHLNGTGNTLNNTLTGNSGNNILTGLAGTDTLTGGDGNDVLDGGAGIDTLEGGLGDDTYVIDNLQDTLVELAGAGTDTVQINGSVDLNMGAFTEIEHIVLTGRGAFNATGDNGDNSMTGNSVANILTGNGGNDTLNGGAGNDQLIGGLGNDLLNGGTGADSLTGGDDDDTYVIDHAGDTITELANEGTDTVQSSISHTLGSEVEHLTLSGTGAINGTGNVLNNILTGNGGANVLTGGAGNDVLAGGAGIDTLNGGADDDTVHGDAGHDQLVGDVGQDTVTGGLGDDRVTMLVSSGNVDDADGGDGNDTLALSGTVGGSGSVIVDLSVSDQVTAIGGVADNLLTQSNFEHLDASGLGVGGSVNVTGSAGNNNLAGSSGSDSLDGGAGNDSLDGGLGNDTLNGDIGNDDLTGGAGSDTLGGGTGNDRLDGGTGNDTLAGGAGNDTYVVDSASDSITEALNGGTDVVESTASVTLDTNVEHLTLLGSASLNGTGNGLDNVLTGNSGNNVLTGLAGADILNGGGGNDTLNGGDGVDTLTGGTGNDQLDGGASNDQLAGGAGNDTFVVGAGDGQDLVQDSSGADRLRFESGSGIDPLDLVISRRANDLRIAVHGTSDHVTIQNWYAGAASQIETIQAANGDFLLSSQVERLIQAMATFSATSGVSWDQALDNPGLVPAVQNIIAANWQ